MKTRLTIRILLIFHLAGLVIMAGTTVVDYFTFKTFCELAGQTDNKAIGLLPIMARFGILVRAGAVLLIVSGVSMLVVEKWTMWQQLWFKIKMLLVILLILNGMFTGNKLGSDFRRVVAHSSANFMHQTDLLRHNLNCFYLIQLVIFLAIIMLSVIKPGKNLNQGNLI